MEFFCFRGLGEAKLSGFEPQIASLLKEEGIEEASVITDRIICIVFWLVSGLQS